MDFDDVIRTRRSIRTFRPDPVPEALMRKLYEALRLAPSGSNHQPYRFIFVRDPAIRQRLAKEACHQDFIGVAPVIMVACCDPGRAFDVAIAVDHLSLAAVNEGLGTCWIGWFEREPAREILGIPADREIPILMPIGYPDGLPAARARKPMEQLVTDDRYR